MSAGGTHPRVTASAPTADGGPVLLAPDSFKGTFSAQRVARALARGVSCAGLPSDIFPLADGGEGTAEAIRRARGGEIRTAQVHGPLGEPLAATFALLADGASAVLDSAAASGLPLVDERHRDPFAASTTGTGELVLAALRAGATHVYIAAGGSASTDGGRGSIEAIEAAGGLKGARLTVLCDVQTPFESAAEVFAPQKGASPEQVELLAARLDDLAATLPRDPRGRPMTGCAGGLSGGLWAAFDAELVRGTDFIFETVGLDAALPRARAVVSGEGRLDEQSLDGKLIGALARHCASHGLGLHVVAGHSALDPELARRAGIVSVREARTEAALVDAGRELALSL